MEYMAIDKAAECQWLHGHMGSIGLSQINPTLLLCDNNAALILSKDPCFHAHVKHINTKWHYIHKFTEDGDICVSYVPSKDNVADILTKPLATPMFVCLRAFLGLMRLALSDWP